MATSHEQVPPVPTQDERTMAMLAHVLAIFSSFIAPLVVYLLKKDSRFVSFHSLQVLIWHAAFALTCFWESSSCSSLCFRRLPPTQRKAPASHRPWRFSALLEWSGFGQLVEGC